MADRVCVVVGAGPGNGRAFAERFATDGYRIALIGRTPAGLDEIAGAVPGSLALPCDAGDPDALAAAFARVRADLGPVDVLLYNAGAAPWGSFEEITPEGLEAGWRLNVLGLLVAAQAVTADMTARGTGAIVITGATASLRGNPGTAAFASAKAGQRALAQSIAKTLGPRGVHVAYVVVDGVIATPAARARFGADKPDDFFLKPAEIAETMHMLAHQDRSAWTFELDLRPFGERW